MGYVRASRLLIAMLLVLAAWLELAASPIQAGQADEAIHSGGRPTTVTSRGGPRPPSGPSQGRDVLATRPQIPTPTASPTPLPTPTPKPPEPTPTPRPQLQYLGVFRVTGYSDSPLNGTDGRGITRSGEPTRWGVVAVDPHVIPLGSRLMIEGWNGTVFTALDTGGGVIGRWVDVWFETDSEAIRFGTRELGVYLVKK